MLELVLEGEDLLLKPAVEGLELLLSRMIGDCCRQGLWYAKLVGRGVDRAWHA